MTLTESKFRISEYLGITYAEVNAVARKLRESGLLPTATNNRNPPEMTPQDIAIILIGLLANVTLRQVSEAVWHLRDLESANGDTFVNWVAQIVNSEKSDLTDCTDQMEVRVMDSHAAQIVIGQGAYSKTVAFGPVTQRTPPIAPLSTIRAISGATIAAIGDAPNWTAVA